MRAPSSWKRIARLQSLHICRHQSSIMGDSEELQQQGSAGGTVEEEVVQQAQDPGTPGKDGSFLKMPPVDTDKGGKSDGAGEQIAVSTEQPGAEPSGLHI